MPNGKWREHGGMSDKAPGGELEPEREGARRLPMLN